MHRQLLIVGAVVVVLFLLIGSGLFGPLAIMGYDGIESTMNRVEHTYGDQAAGTHGIGSTGLTFDPATNALPFLDVNGVHIDIQEPNVLSYESLDPITQSTIETRDGIQVNVTKTWNMQIVHLEMAAHVFTTGTGFAAMSNTKLWVRLHENDYSVFMNTDESDAYILNVFTSRETEQSGGYLNQISPLASGIDVELRTVTPSTVPQWVIDSGYTGQLTNFRDVEFPITVVQMQRHSIAQVVITEAENSMWFGVDVLLFGYWEHIKPYREYERTFADWLGDLWLMLMTPLGMILGIVAIIGTMIVLWKAPGYFLKVFGVVAIWVMVLFLLTMFGVFAL